VASGVQAADGLNAHAGERSSTAVRKKAALDLLDLLLSDELRQA
jgi:hypothetical protein